MKLLVKRHQMESGPWAIYGFVVFTAITAHHNNGLICRKFKNKYPWNWLQFSFSKVSLLYWEGGVFYILYGLKYVFLFIPPSLHVIFLNLIWFFYLFLHAYRSDYRNTGIVIQAVRFVLKIWSHYIHQILMHCFSGQKFSH